MLGGLMGCAQSRQPQKPPSGGPSSPSSPMRKRGARASLVGNFAQDETAKDQARLVTSDGTRTLALSGGTSLRYAYVSQRGFYPDAPDKANQDAVCATERLGGAPDAALFGVFDGHGEYGAECAQFALDKMAANLAKDKGLSSSPEAALRAATLATNAQLHRAPIDDSLSGTTACTALVAGRTAYVANVGDSRAVIAVREPGGRLVAKDLSSDQTPFREDERLRVQAAGARVLTLDQLEGLKDSTVQCWTNEDNCDGDPPRLWSPHGLFPGTAFTRSIGDTAAEDIGVFAEPEISATSLSADTPLLLIASDGVWEFVSSQRAVDIASKCDNPYDAAKTIVATAYKLWLQKETRTDDISIAVVFFDGLGGGGTPKHGSSSSATPYASSSPAAVQLTATASR